MRKSLLTLLCLLALGLPALAETLTITPSDFTGFNGNSYQPVTYSNTDLGLEIKGVANLVTTSIMGLKSSGGYLVMTKNDQNVILNKISITAKTGSSKTTKLLVNKNSSAYEFNTTQSTITTLPGTKADEFSMTTEGQTFTANVEDFYFGMRNSTSSGQVQISKIVIEYTPTLAPTFCQTPTFSPEGKDGGVRMNVGETLTATCETTNSTVYLLKNNQIIATGNPGSGTVSYTLDQSLVGQDVNFSAYATVQGESEIIQSETASLTVKVTVLPKFKQIKSTDDLEEGARYVLAYTTSKIAMSNSTEKEKQRAGTTVDITDGILIANEETMLINLEKSGEKWKLIGTNYPGAEKYLKGAYSDNTDLGMVGSTNATEFTISFSTQGNASIGSKVSTTDREIRFNSSYSDFRYYATTAGLVIQMYKEIVDEPTVGMVTVDKEIKTDSNNDNYIELKLGEKYTFSSEGAAKLYIDLPETQFEAENPAVFYAPYNTVARQVVNSITPIDAEGNKIESQALKNFYITVVDTPEEPEYITATFDYTTGDLAYADMTYGDTFGTIEPTGVFYNYFNATEVSKDSNISYVADKGWKFGTEKGAVYDFHFVGLGYKLGEEYTGEQVHATSVKFKVETDYENSLSFDKNDNGNTTDLVKSTENGLTTFTWTDPDDKNYGVLSFEATTIVDFTLKGIDVEYCLPAIPVPFLTGVENNTKVHLSLPEGKNHDIFYKVETVTETASDMMRAASDEGFTKYDNQPFEFGKDQQVTYFAAHPDSGREGSRRVVTYNDFAIMTGVNTIGIDTTGSVRYFNLQGVEVASPTPGQIYIRVADGKVSKVAL